MVPRGAGVTLALLLVPLSSGSPLLEDGGWGWGCLLQCLHTGSVIKSKPRISPSFCLPASVTTCAISWGSLLLKNRCWYRLAWASPGRLSRIQGGPWKCKKHWVTPDLGERIPEVGRVGVSGGGSEALLAWHCLHGERSWGTQPQYLDLGSASHGQGCCGTWLTLPICAIVHSQMASCSLENVNISSFVICPLMLKMATGIYGGWEDDHRAEDLKTSHKDLSGQSGHIWASGGHNWPPTCPSTTSWSLQGPIPLLLRKLLFF